MSEITQAVIDWVKANCLKGNANLEVTEATELLATNLLDSMDFLNLVAHLEESFGIKLDPDDLSPENFETPATVAALVERSQG